MVFDETEIRRAFDEDEFFPAFQPLVELRTGQLTGLEILARWKHKQLGLIPPDNFIPCLEKFGKKFDLIDRLTRTLLEKAFARPELVNSTLILTVNVSAPQVLSPGAVERFAAFVERSGFPPERLTIEITESALLDDLPRAQAAARELKASHCKLALDDFGTGYSSLRHLQALPFDMLKVDRSFVSSMTEKRESRKIVAGVVGLGNSLGLTTVAEGVETREQAKLLLLLGCDVGQGWLFGRPAPGEELPRMMAEAQGKGSFAVPEPLDEDLVLSLEALPDQRLAQLQAIYDGAPVGLCFLDRKLRYVSINRFLAKMNGAPAAAHVGKTVEEMIPHFFPRVEPYIRRAMEGEPISGVEFQRPRTDASGESESIMVSYQPALDEAGEVLGVSVAVMDVTARKRTEEALRASESRYRDMVRLSPHVPWVLNAKGEVVDASPRWESITGQPMEEAMGTGWLRMLYPDDVAPTQEAIRAALETGDPIDIEYRVRRPGENWVWMRSRGSPRFGPSDEIVSIYGVVEEVHLHKQLSDELDSCRIELREALNAVPIGIVLADAQDCRIYMVNPAAKRIFGNAIFAGQKLNEYSRLRVFGEDGRLFQAHDFLLARAVLNGETVEAKHVLYERDDGTRTHLLASSKAILADDGQLIGGLLIVRDLDAEG